MAGRPTAGRRRDAPREPDRIKPQPVPVPTPPPPPPPPQARRRAGGHVDRGDGRGWVLDDDEEV